MVPVDNQSPSSLIPSKALPWIAGLVGLAGVGLGVFPEHTIAFKVCAGIMGAGVVLGIASPGMRKRGKP